MEVQFKKNVRVVCDLDEGDQVMTDNWGPELDGKVHIIEKVIPAIGGCESGFIVKITGYDHTIDSSWLNKIPKQHG